MLLRLLVSHFLQQMAQEKVREVVSQAAREGMAAMSNETDDEGENVAEELPPCDIAFMFAMGVESGGLVDQLRESKRTNNVAFVEDAGGFAGKHVVVAESGVGHDAATRATEDLIVIHKPKWIVSAGFATSLSDDVRRGHILMPDHIIDLAGNRLDVGFQVSPEAVAATKGLHVGPLLTVNEIIRKSAQKRQLFDDHQALACDMETMAIANVCREHKTRFLSVRVIAEGVDDEIPREIENLLDQKTLASKLGAAGGAIFRRPSVVKDMWQLKADATAASDRLAKYLAGVVPQLSWSGVNVEIYSKHVIEAQRLMSEIIAERYTIENELGRGGMGVVWQAEDTQFSRPVALKVMLPEAAESSEATKRFEREAEITAKLQHPSIPPVIQRGSLPDGSPFFSMKLIQGETLHELLRRRRSHGEDLTRVLGIFEQVCQGVGFAHSKGIIHRDVKPANVMVGAFGEVQVMDWGMARSQLMTSLTNAEKPDSHAKQNTLKAVGDAEARDTVTFTGDASGSDGPSPQRELSTIDVRSPAIESDDYLGLTHDGQVMGTLAYMAPEQARGDLASLDSRTDVFALGGILCTILTGKPPYSGKSREDLFQAAHDGDMTNTFQRIDQSGVDSELIELCKSCLSPKQDDRPHDANQIADAIKSYQHSVQTRLDEERQQRAADAVRRRMTLLLASIVTLVLLTAASLGLWYQQDQARQEIEVQARSTQAEHDIEELLAGAESLRDSYRFREATSLLEQAEIRVPDLVSQETLVTTLKQTQRDMAIVVALDDIRMKKTLKSKSHAGSDRSFANGPDGAYSEAFRNYGIEFFGERSPQDIAEAVAQSKVSADLLEGLRDWGWDDGRYWAHIYTVIRLADPTPISSVLHDPNTVTRPEVILELGANLVPHEVPSSTLNTLGKYHHYFEQKQQAADVYRRGLDVYPDDFWLHIGRADMLLSTPKSNLTEALGHYRAGLALRPEAVVIYLNLALVLEINGRLDEAEEVYQAAIRRAKPFAATHNNLALLYRQQDRDDEAEEQYRAAIAVDPDYALAHYNLALLLKSLDRFEEAVASYRNAARLSPNHAATHSNLGLLLEELGHLDEAEKCVQEALRLSPDMFQGYGLLGDIYFRKQRYDDAITNYQELLKRLPVDHPESKRAVERIEECRELATKKPSEE